MLEAVLQHFKPTQDNFTKTVRSCSTFAFAEYNSVCLHCLKTLLIYRLFRANTVVSDKLLPFLRHLNRIEASDSLSSHLLRLSVSFAHLHCPKMCSYSTVKLEQQGKNQTSQLVSLLHNALNQMSPYLRKQQSPTSLRPF